MIKESNEYLLEWFHLAIQDCLRKQLPSIYLLQIKMDMFYGEIAE